jgi:hypothetical protein
VCLVDNEEWSCEECQLDVHVHMDVEDVVVHVDVGHQIVHYDGMILGSFHRVDDTDWNHCFR